MDSPVLVGIKDSLEATDIARNTIKNRGFLMKYIKASSDKGTIKESIEMLENNLEALRTMITLANEGATRAKNMT
jgi:hypothetical protein